MLAWIRRRAGRRGRGALGALLNGTDEMWHRTAVDAREHLDEQHEFFVPAPSPGDPLADDAPSPTAEPPDRRHPEGTRPGIHASMRAERALTRWRYRRRRPPHRSGPLPQPAGSAPASPPPAPGARVIRAARTARRRSTTTTAPSTASPTEAPAVTSVTKW